MNKIYLLLFIILLNSTLNAQITTATLQAASDNSMYSERPNNSNGIGQHIFSGKTNGGGIRRALIKFNFPGPIGGGYAVTDAKLTLYCTLSPLGAPATDISIHRVTKNWGEGTSDAPDPEGTGTTATTGDATWVHALYTSSPWTTQGGDYTATSSATTSINAEGVYYSWSSAQLITDVQNWMNNQTSNFGWIFVGDEANFQTARRFASRENPDALLVPTLEIKYSIIPVKLVSFTATESSKGVQLNWATAQEFNNDYFTIEHSTDGLNFTTVGTVKGIGFSQTLQHYSFSHSGIDAGKHFYRLIQTDKDGKKTTSNSVYILLVKNKINKLVQENPVTENGLKLMANTSLIGYSYQVYNNLGAKLVDGKLNTNVIDVSNLISGVYYLRVIDKNGVITTESFLKQ